MNKVTQSSWAVLHNSVMTVCFWEAKVPYYCTVLGDYVYNHVILSNSWEAHAPKVRKLLLEPDNPSIRWPIPFLNTSTITQATWSSPKMISTRTSFTLKTPTTIRCAHILGSWDLYSRQLPLIKVKEDKEASTWNNTFEFQVTILQPGKRYWYYVCKCIYEATFCSHHYSTYSMDTKSLTILKMP